MKISLNGKGHRILALLYQRSATHEAMFAAAAPTRSPKAAKDVRFLVKDFVAAALIAESRGYYRITDEGAHALGILNEGREYFTAGVPNARVFRRAA